MEKFRKLTENIDKYEARDIIVKHINSSEFNGSVVMDYVNDRDFWMSMSARELDTWAKKNAKSIEDSLNDY